MTIIQKPNPPLVIFLLAILVENIFDDGRIHNAAYAVMVIAGVVWSWLEISDGDSWFRRILGLAVLANIALTLYR